MCNTGVGLTPMIAGKLHHFSAGGLYNGLVLLIDDESRSYWDHTTGEAVHGPLAGTRLPVWPLRMTNVAAALRDDPELRLHRSRPGPAGRLFGWAHKVGLINGRLPPGFRGTMSAVDGRLPEDTIGLGVIEGGTTRFYRLDQIGDGITDEWSGRKLRVAIDEVDHVPGACWEDASDERPMQMFTRWYGFSLTHPGCEIHGG